MSAARVEDAGETGAVERLCEIDVLDLCGPGAFE
jgi:hypothetical protein